MTLVSTGFARYANVEAGLQNEGYNNLFPSLMFITEMVILCVTFLHHGQHLCSWNIMSSPGFKQKDEVRSSWRGPPRMAQK